MNETDLDKRPTLRPGCRISEQDAEPLLLIPEGAMKLIGPGLEIVKLCDGARTVHHIIAELDARYTKTEPGRIEREVLVFLNKLCEKRVLDLA
jgi:coenzyme PQQ biosynthesis protein PqqD